MKKKVCKFEGLPIFYRSWELNLLFKEGLVHARLGMNCLGTASSIGWRAFLSSTSIKTQIDGGMTIMRKDLGQTLSQYLGEVVVD